MICEKIDLYEYFKVERKGATGGYLTVYARTESKELKKRMRSAMLVIPGGGYWFLSDREGEPIALKYLDNGFCAFVLSYSLKTAYPILDWAGTVIRIKSDKRNEVVDIADRLREAWINYDNPELGIMSEDENGVHNAISPTVIKTQTHYEINVILRSNITSEKYPDGVFHAHPEYHSIKKESIGLIEAQGLFILPGRLEEQLQDIEKIIEAKKQLSPPPRICRV